MVEPVVFRAGGFVARPSRRAAWFAFAIIVAGWEAASDTQLLPSLFMPAPHEVARALYRLLLDGVLLDHIGASLSRIVSGWLVGTSFGLLFGFAIGVFSLARAVGLPLTAALFPIPKIALLPLFILWFGIGEPSKIATIAFGVFFPTVVSTYSAIDQVPRNLIRMAQSFGMPTSRIVSKVVLPGALAGILSGFRISSSIALILVVSAEMIGTQVGVGAFVLAAGNLMQTDQLIAGVLLLSWLGLAINGVLSALEKTLLRWR